MAYEFKERRRVDFHETDMAGIVHFSNFFRFMESTEHSFFRSLGISLHYARDGRMHGWARVQASCEYMRPAEYEDVLEVHLTVLAKSASTLSYSFVFRSVDEAGQVADEPIARGELKVAHVSRGPDDERIRATEMPAEVASTIEVAPGLSS